MRACPLSNSKVCWFLFVLLDVLVFTMIVVHRARERILYYQGLRIFQGLNFKSFSFLFFVLRSRILGNHLKAYLDFWAYEYFPLKLCCNSFIFIIVMRFDGHFQKFLPENIRPWTSEGILQRCNVPRSPTFRFYFFYEIINQNISSEFFQHVWMSEKYSQKISRKICWFVFF